jgi:hypothetical protein
MPNALDISHFTYNANGPLTQEDIDNAWGEGIRKFIVSIAEKDKARQQIMALVQDGRMAVETYRYIYWNYSDWANSQDKLFLEGLRTDGANIEMHYLDYEDTSVQLPLETKIEIVHRGIQDYEGFCRTGLYTANWYWSQHMGNTHEFNFMPLWVAYWDKDDDLNFQHFGGWDSAVMKQNAGDITFAGIHCDTNYFELAPQPPPVIVTPTHSYAYQGAANGSHSYQERFSWPAGGGPPDGPGPRVEHSPWEWDEAKQCWRSTKELYKHW